MSPTPVERPAAPSASTNSAVETGADRLVPPAWMLPLPPFCSVACGSDVYSTKPVSGSASAAMSGTSRCFAPANGASCTVAD